MNLDRKNMRKLMELILFTGFVVLFLIKFDLFVTALKLILQILTPFIMGSAMAFILNLPMSFFEKLLFSKSCGQLGTKIKHEKWKRPVSLTLALLSVILIIALVTGTVIPQLISTGKVLAQKIPVFWNNLMISAEQYFANNEEIKKQLYTLELPEVNWNSLLETIGDFLKNGMGNLASTTFSVAGSIVSGILNFFIAFIFSLYILSQKEKLGDQADRILRAYTKPELYQIISKVTTLLYQNFSNFITGQCLEAVILGSMFVISMTIFRFPYALMIGVLIAFTALIPIVGAFLGCIIGAFLIMVDSPMKAVAFIILFLILQQIEGNLIYPHVVGNSVGLPSIWVLVAVTVGGSLMGVVGMLIFIPLLSTFYSLLREDVNKRNLTNENHVKDVEIVEKENNN